MTLRWQLYTGSIGNYIENDRNLHMTRERKIITKPNLRRCHWSLFVKMKACWSLLWRYLEVSINSCRYGIGFFLDIGPLLANFGMYYIFQKGIAVFLNDGDGRNRGWGNVRALLNVLKMLSLCEEETVVSILILLLIIIQLCPFPKPRMQLAWGINFFQDLIEFS